MHILKHLINTNIFSLFIIAGKLKTSKLPEGKIMFMEETKLRYG